jgi:undecaprenyl-diphosphatase
VASVEIPTVYDGEPSHFRAVGDTAAVARALVSNPDASDDEPGAQRPRLAVLRDWSPRLGAAVAGAIAIGAALPALQPLDSAAFRAINQLGDGPEWIYQALDPNVRNYVLLFVVAVVGSAAVLRRPRYVLGAGLAIVLAGYLSGVALEAVKVFVDRPRPEEVLESVLLAENRSWSHIAAYPSGHMVVTAALAAVGAAVAPSLRRPLAGYVIAVAFTRVLFGAHFPLDVLVGTVLGYEVGLFATALIANARLLPARLATGPSMAKPQMEGDHAMGHVRP